MERDGVTVIPVARAFIGFGGGGDERHRAEGGGGGGLLLPMGFVEIKQGNARFRPIYDVRILLMAGIIATLSLTRLARFIVIMNKRGRDARHNRLQRAREASHALPEDNEQVGHVGR